MFQLKSFLGILASQINRLRVASQVLTDFNVGSNVRTILEAVAQEIDELYQQMVAALQAAIAQAVYTSFGFTPLPAVSASGSIRVTIAGQTSPVTVANGTVFTPVNGGAIVYASTAQVTIPAGNTYADIPVVASVPGIAGNVAVGVTFTAGPSPIGFLTAQVLVALANGLDQETLAAQYVRFQSYIQSLARSTLAGIRYGASSVFITDQYGNTIERVTAVQVFEPYSVDTTQPAWLFQVFIYNGVGAAPGASGALVQAVLTTMLGTYDAAGNPIDGYKAAGTQVQVIAATINAVPITGALVLASGTVSATATAAVEAFWAAYVAALPLGASVIVGKLEAIAFSVTGVIDCHITAPAANVAGSVGTQMVPGALSVTSSGGT